MGLNRVPGNEHEKVAQKFDIRVDKLRLAAESMLAKVEKIFPPELRKAVDFRQFGVTRRPHCVPVLVTCSRQALGTSILSSLHQTLTQIYGRGTKKKLVREVEGLLNAGHEPTDDQIFRLILEVNSRIIVDSKGKGLILILDELGKFLEFAALHPQRQDIFLLQRLAEAASRSGDQALFVVCLLHQGFSALGPAQPISPTEWEKFADEQVIEEIVLNHSYPRSSLAQCHFLRCHKRPHKGNTTNGVTRILRQASGHEGMVRGWFGLYAQPRLGSSPSQPAVPPTRRSCRFGYSSLFRRNGQN